MRGNVKSSVRTLPTPLPTISQNPLSSIPSLVHTKGIGIDFDVDNNPEYDVFISHVSEDKDKIVRPLATALKERNISVWYDEFEMKIGDSLRRKIDKGSQIAGLVLSFYQKISSEKAGRTMNWTALLRKPFQGSKSFFPFGIT